MTFGIKVRLLVGNPGDAFGEGVTIGGNRTGGLTGSPGRGIFEVERELFNVIEELNDEDGIRIQEKAKSAAIAVMGDNGFTGGRDYFFEAVCVADPFYHPPVRIYATGGSGQIAVSWTNAPVRFDTVKNRLIYKSGATAPTSVSDGTEFVLASNLASSGTITGLAADTYSVSVFVSYADFGDDGDATIRNSSAALSKTSITVT